jgi:hypothetical protein
VLAAMLKRVHEHAAAFGFSVPSGDDASEHFAALVTSSLHHLQLNAHLLEEGSPTRHALVTLAAGEKKSGVGASGAASVSDEGCEAACAALFALSDEDKDALLRWSQALLVLLQACGQGSHSATSQCTITCTAPHALYFSPMTLIVLPLPSFHCSHCSRCSH